MGGVAGIALWWVVIMAGFHGYHFMKSLFHNPRSSDPNHLTTRCSQPLADLKLEM
jgi:hypothetical protein